MADNNDTYQPGTVDANRAQMQGLGAGQKDIDAQLEPTRDEYATDPQRTEPFDNDPITMKTNQPDKADFTGQDVGGAEPPREGRSFEAGARNESAPGAELDDRNAAGMGDGDAQLGAGTPPNVDIHKTGGQDNPEDDWGEDVEGVQFSSTNTRKGVRTEADRGQGAKTRAANKDIISRRT